MPDERSDEELMESVRMRDEAAFETLVRRHEERAYHIAFRVIGKREDARDVTADVFFKLWLKPTMWKPTALFTTWLYRVTVNRALGRLKAQRLKAFISLSEVTPDEEPPMEDDPADERMIDREDKRRLRSAMKQLPDSQRLALIFRYEFEFSVARIADTLGVTFKSAESLLFRGKQNLKKLMSESS